MKDTNTATTLMIGVKNIERMKEEIEMIIGLILSLATEEVTSAAELRDLAIEKGVNNRNWFFGQYGHRPDEWDLNYNDDKNCVQVVRYIRGKVVHNGLYREHVQSIHQGLSSFIEWMAWMYPNIDKEIRPFIEAADAV
jgi:hypothetical protein